MGVCAPWYNAQLAIGEYVTLSSACVRSHCPCFVEEGSSARLRDLPETTQLASCHRDPGLQLLDTPGGWLLLGSWPFCFYNVESSLHRERGRRGDTPRGGGLMENCWI